MQKNNKQGSGRENVLNSDWGEETKPGDSIQIIPITSAFYLCCSSSNYHNQTQRMNLVNGAGICTLLPMHFLLSHL